MWEYYFRKDPTRLKQYSSENKKNMLSKTEKKKNYLTFCSRTCKYYRVTIMTRNKKKKKNVKKNRLIFILLIFFFFSFYITSKTILGWQGVVVLVVRDVQGNRENIRGRDHRCFTRDV